MANTFTHLNYHLVFSTKRRLPLIERNIQFDLYAYISGIIKIEGGRVIQIGGIEDHIHIALGLSKNINIPSFVRRVKSLSSKWMNERLHKHEKFAWQRGYGLFTVSESQMHFLQKYISNQREHHRKESYKDEFRKMLVKNRISFDERYLVE